MSAETTVEPVLRSVSVRRPVAEAFRIFTEEIGSWWPLDTHSRAVAQREEGGVKAETVVIEGRIGGRIYEVMSDGTEASWGEVLIWEPPHRLVLSWNPSPRRVPTEVEVTFTAHEDGTRVELEHRGWERLGEAAREVREEYAQGWPVVLGRFAPAADGQAV
jgi:uncharacterized protein YndB with AHSA1/START domain